MLYKRLPSNLQQSPDVVAAFQLLQVMWQKDYQVVPFSSLPLLLQPGRVLLTLS